MNKIKTEKNYDLFYILSEFKFLLFIPFISIVHFFYLDFIYNLALIAIFIFILYSKELFYKNDNYSGEKIFYFYSKILLYKLLYVPTVFLIFYIYLYIKNIEYDSDIFPIQIYFIIDLFFFILSAILLFLSFREFIKFSAILLFSMIFFNEITFSLILLYLIFYTLYFFNDKEKVLHNIHFIFCYIFTFIILLLLFSILPFLSIEFIESNLSLIKSSKRPLDDIIFEFFNSLDYSNYLFISILAIKDLIIIYLVTIIFIKKPKSKKYINIMYFILFINLIILILLFIFNLEKFKDYILNIFFITTFLLILTIIKDLGPNKDVIIIKFKNMKKVNLIFLLLIPILILIGNIFEKNNLENIISFSIIFLSFTLNTEFRSNLDKNNKIIFYFLCSIFILLSLILYIILSDNVSLFAILAGPLLSIIYFINFKTIKEDEFLKYWKKNLSKPEIYIIKKYEIDNEYNTNNIIEKLIKINNDIDNKKIKISKKFDIKIFELLEHLKNNYPNYE